MACTLDDSIGRRHVNGKDTIFFTVDVINPDMFGFGRGLPFQNRRGSPAQELGVCLAKLGQDALELEAATNGQSTGREAAKDLAGGQRAV